jgi:hypothetical protein
MNYSCLHARQFLFLLMPLLLQSAPPCVHAADHQEAPGSTARLAADIGDYFVWHAEGNLNLVLTFGTFAASGAPAMYDRDVLYGLHFDTSIPADGGSDLDIFIRFSQNVDGEWGVQLSGIGTELLEGPVETVLSNTQMSAWAGQADDPFFFDATGFNQTVTTGTLSFDPTRDDIAGFNVTAIVIQVPTTAITGSAASFETWATTASL